MHGQTSKGFTLVELMVVIAVVAILAVVAMPSYQALMDNYRVRKAGEGVVSLISNARSGAVKLHRQVGVKVVKGTSWCAGAISAVLPPAGTLAGSADLTKCTCSDTSKCLVDTEEVAISIGAHPGVEVTSNDTSLFFNGVTGATEGLGGATITLDSPLKKFAATVVVTPLGQANLTIAQK